MKHHRTELEKYFKYVKTCVICKKLYGSDSIKQKRDKICPSCSGIGIRLGWREKVVRMVKNGNKEYFK